MATLKITGVDPELAEFVQRRSRDLKFTGQAEYLRNLLREDWLKATSEKERKLTAILGPIHEATAATNVSEEELEQAIASARQARAQRLQ